jgi:hypothetical protein
MTKYIPYLLLGKNVIALHRITLVMKVQTDIISSIAMSTIGWDVNRPGVNYIVSIAMSTIGWDVNKPGVNYIASIAMSTIGWDVNRPVVNYIAKYIAILEMMSVWTFITNVILYLLSGIWEIRLYIMVRSSQNFCTYCFMGSGKVTWHNPKTGCCCMLEYHKKKTK